VWPDPQEAALGEWTDLAGAIHVHSTYSDGAGDIPAVMAGAAAAGNVDFVLLTDHNTQRPLRDGWESRYEDQRPFLLIGTEVTVEEGAFILALDLPPEWEPIKQRPPQEAIDAVRAERGIALISLPFDVKHPWRDWETRGYVGLEVLNLSTVARRHINFLSLLWLLPVARMRGVPAALRQIVTRPDQALHRWDSLTAGGERQMIGLGALDAHAMMKIGARKYPIPSYTDSFRVVTTHILVPHADSESDASTRKRALYSALRQGRCYFAYDCLGDPAGFSFHGRPADGGPAIPMGGRGCIGTVLEAAAPGASTLIRLFRNGKLVAASWSGGLRHCAGERGAYRVEVSRHSARLGPLALGARPWVFSNPLYIT
jgi:hypothetical protein